jgi:hypothetical protein
LDAHAAYRLLAIDGLAVTVCAGRIGERAHDPADVVYALR